MNHPPVIPVETIEVRPVPPTANAGAAVAPPAPPAAEAPPIHAFSALLLLAVDNLWNLADWAVLSWLFTVPLAFITVFVPVYLIQRWLRNDARGRALAFAALLAVLAAVPTSITGTPIGIALLAWTGISRFRK
jgi:hypothetical protein